MQFIIALATDYDSTIATNSAVEASTLAALERLKASGRKLVLVTGRELPDLKNVFPHLAMFDRVVAENGALLHRPDTHETAPLGEEAPVELIRRLEKAGIPLSVGRSILATVEPYEKVALEAIRELGLEMQIIFNKGSVMILPAGVNKATGLVTALDELGLSSHNSVGIGDAENDHAFLRLCGVSAAVANALPSVKAECDLVTEGRAGTGVAELIDRILDDDLKSVSRRRHAIPLAETLEGEKVLLRIGCVLLAAGSSGGGKSTFLMGLMERLCQCRYQYCAIDPEGDYDHMDGAVVLGTPQRAPKVKEVMELLHSVRENAIVNLVGLPFADRAVFLTELLAELITLRARTARPHWIILDEAHHLFPTANEQAALALPEEVTGLIMATVAPRQIAPAALTRVDDVLVLGDRPQETMEQVCRVLGNADAPKLPHDLAKGVGVLWRRSETTPRTVRIIEPRQQRQRHARKYAEGRLPESRSFYFRGPEARLNLRAQNLTMFLQMAEGIDEETWLHHLKAGDYSRWFRDCIKDDDLANEAASIELDGMDAQESRARIRDAVERRYAPPAEPA
jgi:hydroxymethylpyrimidine pyrophosphatase-like HAD family hydrolase